MRNQIQKLLDSDLSGNDNLIMYTFDCLNMYNF